MESNNVRFNVIVLLLSLFATSYAIGGNNLVDAKQKQKHIGRHSSLHMHFSKQIVFFPPENLEVGRQFRLRSIGTFPPSDLRLLSKEEAYLIPFTSSKLPSLLDFFGFPEGSPQAQGMQSTLELCETEPLEGEVVHCATSLESMLDFVREMLPVPHVKPLYTPPLENMSNTSVMYTYTIIDEPRQVPVSKLVACHLLPYPYALYYCHTPDNFSKVFKVPIRVEGNTVDAIVNCHMNTTKWNPAHNSFTVSGIKHGSPACHFMPADHLNWVPSFDPRHLKGLPKLAQM